MRWYLGWPGQALQRCDSVLRLCRFNPFPSPRHRSCPNTGLSLPHTRAQTPRSIERPISLPAYSYCGGSVPPRPYSTEPYSESPALLPSTAASLSAGPWMDEACFRDETGQLPDRLGITNTSQAAGIYQASTSPDSLLPQPVFIPQRRLAKEEQRYQREEGVPDVSG